MMVCSRHGRLYSSLWKISPEAQFMINPESFRGNGVSIRRLMNACDNWCAIGEGQSPRI